MPGTTPIYGFPYPEPTDLVADYPALGQQLAEDVETEIAAASVIKQVVTTNKTDTFSASVTGNGGESGDVITVTITPGATSSKVLILVNANVAGTEAGLFIRLYRGSTRIYQGDTASNRQRVAASTRNVEPATPMNLGFMFIDSPATTSATTYAVRISHQASTTQTVYLNRGVGDGDTAATPRTASSITVLEVKG
jgi:hypothetical protein